MRLTRRLQHLEKQKPGLASAMRQQPGREQAERYRALLCRAEARLEAEGHVRASDEPFLEYLSRGIGLAPGRFNQALETEDEITLMEFFEALTQQFPDLDAEV